MAGGQSGRMGRSFGHNVLVPSHRLVDVRQAVLEQAGVDKQVISLTAPGTLMETPRRSAELSRIVYDSFAATQQEHGEHFVALGTLPLSDPAACEVELERATSEHALKGMTLMSNANGVPLSDPCFWPMYERANEREVLFFVHPTYPVAVEAMTDFVLMPLAGFVTDMTLAAASLIFSGVVERFPRIRWALAHLGGAVPYLAERFGRGYEAYPVSRVNIRKPPSQYLNKQFYYDTVNFDPAALALAIDFAGVDHLVAGSDFPHQLGSLEKMVSSIRQPDITQQDKADILGGSGARLLER
jgi:aminocarboxymuconate-semialdehyde decarboxylase